MWASDVWTTCIFLARNALMSRKIANIRTSRRYLFRKLRLKGPGHRNTTHGRRQKEYSFLCNTTRIQLVHFLGPEISILGLHLHSAPPPPPELTPKRVVKCRFLLKLHNYTVISWLRSVTKLLFTSELKRMLNLNGDWAHNCWIREKLEWVYDCFWLWRWWAKLRLCMEIWEK